jgi:hypothetical protein
LLTLGSGTNLINTKQNANTTPIVVTFGSPLLTAKVIIKGAAIEPNCENASIAPAPIDLI